MKCLAYRYRTKTGKTWKTVNVRSEGPLEQAMKPSNPNSRPAKMETAHLHQTMRNTACLSDERPRAPCFTYGAHEHATTRISAVSPWKPAASVSLHGARYRRVPSPARLKCGAQVRTRGSPPTSRNRLLCISMYSGGTACQPIDAGIDDGCSSPTSILRNVHAKDVSPCLNQCK